MFHRARPFIMTTNEKQQRQQQNIIPPPPPPPLSSITPPSLSLGSFIDECIHSSPKIGALGLVGSVAAVASTQPLVAYNATKMMKPRKCCGRVTLMQLFLSLVIGTSSICMLFVQRRFVALTAIDHDTAHHLQAPQPEQRQQPQPRGQLQQPRQPKLDLNQKDHSSHHHQTLSKSSALLKSSPRFLQLKGKLSSVLPKLAALKPTIPFQAVRTIPSRSAQNATTVTTLQPFTNQSFSSSSSYWESIQSKSSVDYYTCCGLGHRMSKLVDANYIAQKFNIGLRVHWGFCGGGNNNNNNNNNNKNSQTTEVFDYLFGPQPAQELETVTETNWRLIIANEAPGFKKIIRDQSVEHCQQKCSVDAATEHAIYYEKLRTRFRRIAAVEAFRNEYLPTTNFTVIAIHVRAGNGEQGDFVKKKRGIEDQNTWTQSVVDTLWRMTQEWPASTLRGKPPLLFVATDTPSIVTEFRNALMGKMPVVEYQQARAKVGQGVIFGAGPFTTTTATTKNGGEEDGRQACLADWENAVIDMMLVSHADVIVSGRPSSFTQSLPMSIALARPRSERPILANYCELGRNGTTSRCYEDFTQWCCKGRSDFHLEGMPTRYEYRRMPVNLEAEIFDIVKRPPHPRPPPNPCTRFGCILPYNWSTILPEGENKP
jgi:hypothetical protein